MKHSPAKRITFLLNSEGHLPAGGKRVVYEYASRLAARGWDVAVVHPVDVSASLTVKKKIVAILRFFKWKVTKSFLPTKWFWVSPSVRMILAPFLSHHFVPTSDYIIACPIQAALWLNRYPRRKGRKLYFIQGFEDWEMSPDIVMATWKFPMKKIVVALWLQDIAAAAGETACYVPNGLDNKAFAVTIPYGARFPRSVLFVHHSLALKGVSFMLDALVELKRMFPDLAAHCFAPYPRPSSLPDFITFTSNPSQPGLRDLYNKSAVFVAPSLSEGWGLPPCEAMLCGCAVIATDIGGHREFVEDGRNAVLCKPGSAESIVEKVELLFRNPAMASCIAEHAPISLQKFNWETSVQIFEKAILEDEPSEKPA
jgi:glycosyltransferase involved in cell wall biosynthesis